MHHMKKLKEMLSIPTGSSRNVATSGYSSFTDSQLFFGSQFWPENSQSASQDMSLSSRTSQQSSQEASDPKLFANSYQTKALLFGELKDKGNISGLLDKFEEAKRLAKDKADSDVLAKECHHFREALNNIQQLVAGTEKNTAACRTVLERFDNFASKMQNNLDTLQSDISQQSTILLNKVSSQKELMTQLEEKIQKSGDSTVELDANLQSLKNSLECVREEQQRERNMVEEALKLLSTLVSEHSAKPIPVRVTDSAIQTSPGLEQLYSNILQDNELESTQLMSQNAECKKAKVPPQGPSCIKGKTKLTLRSSRRFLKRPLVLSQSKYSVTDENSQPLVNCSKKQNVSVPLAERRDLNTVTSRNSLNPDCLKPPNGELGSVAAGCYITPLSCWSQDSSSPACLAGIDPILEKLSAKSNAETPVRPDALWQLFDTDYDS